MKRRWWWWAELVAVSALAGVVGSYAGLSCKPKPEEPAVCEFPPESKCANLTLMLRKRMLDLSCKFTSPTVTAHYLLDCYAAQPDPPPEMFQACEQGFAGMAECKWPAACVEGMGLPPQPSIDPGTSRPPPPPDPPIP